MKINTTALQKYNNISRNQVKADHKVHNNEPSISQNTCIKLVALLKKPSYETQAKKIITALISFKEDRNNGSTSGQEEALNDLNKALNAIAPSDQVPSLDELMTLVKNSGYFIQRDMPDTFKIFLLKLDESTLCEVGKDHKEFLSKNGILIPNNEAEQPLVKIYEAIDRNLVKKVDKREITSKLEQLCKTDSNSATNIITALISFKNARNNTFFGYGAHEQEKALQNLQDALNEIKGNDKPSLRELMIFVKNSSSVVKRDLGDSFKNFLNGHHGLNLASTLNNNPNEAEFLRKNGILVSEPVVEVEKPPLPLSPNTIKREPTVPSKNGGGKNDRGSNISHFETPPQTTILQSQKEHVFEKIPNPLLNLYIEAANKVFKVKMGEIKSTKYTTTSLSFYKEEQFATYSKPNYDDNFKQLCKELPSCFNESDYTTESLQNISLKLKTENPPDELTYKFNDFTQTKEYDKYLLEEQDKITFEKLTIKTNNLKKQYI